MALPVSNQWESFIQLPFRNQGYLNVQLTLSPPGINNDASLDEKYTESITSTRTVFDGVTTKTYPCATFEPNRWVGDGSMYLPSEDKTQNARLCWWTNVAQDSYDLLITLQNVYDIPGMRITWDTETNSWPAEVKIICKDSADRIVKTVQFNGSSVIQDYNFEAFKVKKLILTPSKWSRVGWRARIAQIFFGVVIDLDSNRIKSATYTQSFSPTSEELPQQNMLLTLRNDDQFFDPSLAIGSARYLAQRQVVQCKWRFKTLIGEIEEMPLIPMFVNTFDIPSEDPTVTINLGNRLDFLTQDYFEDSYTGELRDFKSLALTILQKSNIIKLDDAETPWVISDDLEYVQTRAPLPIMPVNALLQLIAQCVDLALIIDPLTGYINFRNYSEGGYSYSIDKNTSLGLPQMEILAELKSLKIGLYQYTLPTSITKVFEGDFYVSGEQVLEINYANNQLVMEASATISVNGRIKSAKFYGYRAVITVETDTSSTITLAINGKILSSSISYIQVYANPSVKSGREIVVDNPLITEMETINNIYQRLLSSFEDRVHITQKYIGFPELEAGDSVSYRSEYHNQGEELDIEKVTIDYNGGWSGTVQGTPVLRT